MDRNVEIYVKPNPDPNGKEPYLFSMDDGKGATNELVFNKSNDNMPKSEHYKIKFKLKNKEGAQLRFSQLATKVMWAKPVALVTDPCPDSDCYMDGVFYVDPDATIKDHEVTVINTDPSVQLFKFGFNFLPPGESDPPPSGYIYYDPIGNNQNGGFPISKSSLAPAPLYVGAGAVAGVLVTLLVNNEATVMTYLSGAVIGGLVGYVAGLLLGRSGVGAVRSAPHA